MFPSPSLREKHKNKNHLFAASKIFAGKYLTGNLCRIGSGAYPETE